MALWAASEALKHSFVGPRLSNHNCASPPPRGIASHHVWAAKLPGLEACTVSFQWAKPNLPHLAGDIQNESVVLHCLGHPDRQICDPKPVCGPSAIHRLLRPRLVMERCWLLPGPREEWLGKSCRLPSRSISLRLTPIAPRAFLLTGFFSSSPYAGGGPPLT